MSSRPFTVTAPTELPEFLQDLSSGPIDTLEEPMPAEDVPTEPTPAQEEHHHLDYTPDYRALDDADGDSDVWAAELFQLIGHATGQWIDQGTLQSWLDTLALQVQRRTYKQAAFQVANTPLPPDLRGDPSFLLLQLRDDLVKALKRGATS